MQPKGKCRRTTCWGRRPELWEHFLVCEWRPICLSGGLQPWYCSGFLCFTFARDSSVLSMLPGIRADQFHSVQADCNSRHPTYHSSMSCRTISVRTEFVRFFSVGPRCCDRLVPWRRHCRPLELAVPQRKMTIRFWVRRWPLVLFSEMSWNERCLCEMGSTNGTDSRQQRLSVASLLPFRQKARMAHTTRL